jgi:GH15 family glucan-1,4-alpha-glucosidase
MRREHLLPHRPARQSPGVNRGRMSTGGDFQPSAPRFGGWPVAQVASRASGVIPKSCGRIDPTSVTLSRQRRSHRACLAIPLDWHGMTESRHGALIQSSRQVFTDCMLENGALVAAPSHMPYYPEGAKNYRFVWPRDALFICRAGRLVGLDLHDRFLRWCMAAEGWAETGLFYEKYNPDGSKARHRWQPDQTGSVLLAIHDRYKDGELPGDMRQLLTLSADALCSNWSGHYFADRSNDLWEERFVSADIEGNFTYTLAACAAGLMAAHALRPTEAWRDAAQQMLDEIDRAWPSRFGRSSGLVRDPRVDSSLLGLVYPFGAVSSDDHRMEATLMEMEARLWTSNGLLRYEGDNYDGWMFPDGVTNRKLGAGAWPLLNFWLATVLNMRGETERAREIFDFTVDRIPASGLIPEQLFDNEVQKGVSPLAWSHAMFLIAGQAIFGDSWVADRA